LRVLASVWLASSPLIRALHFPPAMALPPRNKKWGMLAQEGSIILYVNPYVESIKKGPSSDERYQGRRLR
jgi:hypothetical protein